MKWIALGESVPGTSHSCRGTPCQDAFRFRLLGPSSEWLVIAVADGAGSATHAELGATLACDEFVRLAESLEIGELDSRSALAELFADVRSELLDEAKRLDIRPRDLACTALLAVVGPASAVFAQIGDGAIVFAQGQEHRLAFWPEPSEYVNSTDFLTDDAFAELMQFESVLGQIDEVAVLTDGLQRLALDFAAKLPHPEFFRPLFEELRKAEDAETLVVPFRSFLESSRINERTDDDKTLVLAVRHPCPRHLGS
jgi:hypothetical protein